MDIKLAEYMAAGLSFIAPENDPTSPTIDDAITACTPN